MNKKHFTDQILEQFILRELSQDKIDEIIKHIEIDDSLRERVESIKRSNEEILETYPPEVFVKNIKEQYEKSISQKTEKRRLTIPDIIKFLYPAAALMSAAVIFFAVNIFIETPEYIDDKIEVTRVKGMKSQLYIFKKNNSSVEILKDGSIARENDLLQLAYVATEDTHGIIFSIDGRGTVTLQYPDNPYSSTKITPGRKNLLSKSYELDDAPDFERFYFITSKSKINTERILEKARDLAADPLKIKKGDIVFDENLNQYSTFIIKGKGKDEN